MSFQHFAKAIFKYSSIRRKGIPNLSLYDYNNIKEISKPVPFIQNIPPGKCLAMYAYQQFQYEWKLIPCYWQSPDSKTVCEIKRPYKSRIYLKQSRICLNRDLMVESMCHKLVFSSHRKINSEELKLTELHLKKLTLIVFHFLMFVITRLTAKKLQLMNIFVKLLPVPNNASVSDM